MNGFWTSARHEVLSITRARIALLLLMVFVGMVSVSAIIGWITTRTVTSVYEGILAAGLTAAPNPFTDVAPLYYARNSAIYVVLIGCLMAIVLGAQATLRDRKQGTSILVLTRPLAIQARLLGQRAGIGLVLATVSLVSTLISWVSIAIITGTPLGGDLTARLVGFAGTSWLLLMVFAIIGMISGLFARRESTAFLVPFVVWSGITFVLPQLGSAARPVALLNPVPAVPVAGDSFSVLSALTGPLAITEQFKTTASVLLQNDLVVGSAGAGVLVLAIFLLAGLIAITVIPRRKIRSALHD